VVLGTVFLRLQHAKLKKSENMLKKSQEKASTFWDSSTLCILTTRYLALLYAFWPNFVGFDSGFLVDFGGWEY